MNSNCRLISFSVITLAFLTSSSVGSNFFAEADQEASRFCFTCKHRRNNKDHYADPFDCHAFFQCFYVNETFAVGIKRRCPSNQRWNEDILQCTLEGNTPCSDPCSDPSLKCYPNQESCSSYFECANATSIPKCCLPDDFGPYRRFNGKTCNCENDDSCRDDCYSTDESVVTTFQPPTTGKIKIATDVICQDKFGNYLELITSKSDYFILHSQFPPTDRSRRFRLQCPFKTGFSISECGCTRVENNQAHPRTSKCILYLPFEDDASDHSKSKYSTFIVGNASIIQSNAELVARGYGAFAFDGGWLEVPGLKSLGFGLSGSWCLFFKCSGGKCSKDGGLLSNKKDESLSEFSVDIVIKNENEVWASIKLLQSQHTFNLTSSINSTDFNQVCLVFNGYTLTLFVNNKAVAIQKGAVGDIAIGHCPYTVGFSWLFGSIHGIVDEVLICTEALSAEEVNAHWQGNEAMQEAELIPFFQTVQSASSRATQQRPAKPMLGIFGGQNIEPNQYPWMVYIVTLFRSGLYSTCGGSLISDSWVLTAAHCVSDPNDIYYLGIQDISVYLGRHDLIQSGAGAADRKWGLVVRHGSFDRRYTITHHDFALIKLDSPIVKTDQVAPIDLPDSHDMLCRTEVPETSAETDRCTTATIAGWGRSEWGFSPIPKAVTLDLVSRQSCSQQWSMNLDEVHLCAGDGSAGACMGDSGSSLFCLYNNRNYLIGVPSIVATDGQGNCNVPGYPNIYGRVCKVIAWIRNTMKQYP